MGCMCRSRGQRASQENKLTAVDHWSQEVSGSCDLLLFFVSPSPAADETFSFKYSPGKLRGNQYKSMMTKEELEEEQR